LSHRCSALVRFAAGTLGGGAAAAQLAAGLEGGMGAEVVAALLMAANGAMPSWMISPISETLHVVCTAAGPMFAAWLEAALRGGAGFHGLPCPAGELPAKDAKVLEELCGEVCRNDERKFKKHLKAFCGGKKKGEVTNTPPKSSKDVRGVTSAYT